MTDASLFAHIQNDAFLQGSYELQGNQFLTTASYLKKYLKRLKSNGEGVDPVDLQFLKDTDYLVKIEQCIKGSSGKQSITSINKLAESIVQDLVSLPLGKKLLLPGGWLTKNGGHAMIYQWSRGADGYLFTVINSGAGLQYHAKKSSEQKELRNPTRTWFVPVSENMQTQAEMAAFISRLLQAQLHPALQIKPVNEEVLYNELLEDISYINGKEIDASLNVPEHAWTGGQISGTCAQRVIHQMLKINSKSAEAYQQTIFKFKLYNLEDYMNRCINGREPFTAAVADHIQLAIENNLKILNNRGLFNENKTSEYFRTLGELRLRLQQAVRNPEQNADDLNDPVPSLSIADRFVNGRKPSAGIPVQEVVHPLTIDLGAGKNLLSNLALVINDIKQVDDFAIRYLHLQTLILALPLNPQGLFDAPFYAELQTLENYTAFAEHIKNIQTLMQQLQDNWLKTARISAFNHLVLSVVSLHIDAHAVITNKRNLPSFKPFAAEMMASFVNNHERDPFSATNHPVFDQRITMLRARFKVIKLEQFSRQTPTAYYNYFNNLLASEYVLKTKLNRQYHKMYAADVSDLHKAIRVNDLEALYMVSLAIQGGTYDAEFLPIIKKTEEHLDYELSLQRMINPFFKSQKSGLERLKFVFRYRKFNLLTPLEMLEIATTRQSTKITQHKYAVKDSPVQDALDADIETHCIFAITPKSGNHIQLKPVANTLVTQARVVTEADIIARDYFHLRTKPSLQIALTLDYFTRHIAKMSDDSQQRYVEANLFQPGLLLRALQTADFLPQFDAFLKKGQRFFVQNGVHSCHTLIFVRLDYLVSHYLALSGNQEGVRRLTRLQEDLLKQLAVAVDPDVSYVLQQYLFLTIMARIEAGEATNDVFALAFSAYFYIQGHTNPGILEDTSHRIHIDCAMASFQLIISTHPETQVKQAVKDALLRHEQTNTSHLTINGSFPVYSLVDTQGEPVYYVNAVLGKLFEQGFAICGVPLAIRLHPLIQHEGLQNVRRCLMSADGRYMLLSDQVPKVHLFYENDNLNIQREYVVQGQAQEFELQALSIAHEAHKADKNTYPVRADLPNILKDGSMDYWKATSKSRGALLLQNKLPIYSLESNKLTLLDSKGFDTSWRLDTLDLKWRKLFNRFEGNDFLLAHIDSSKNWLVKLPRYDLAFERKYGDAAFVCTDTGESLVDGASPVHPSVAGLLLEKDARSRYLIPVSRFYATKNGAKKSDFYPVIHDTQGVIAKACLEEQWENSQLGDKPLWHYENSERYVSFQMKDGEPLADNSADALYLAYIYLASNQIEKAWKILEDCHTRLGGLTGSPAELQYISWICNELPHLLPGGELSDAIRQTPPYVACQLKAMSLLCDYLAEDRIFDLKAPDLSANTANSCYAQRQYADMQGFLSALPETIYSSFISMQRMDRHLEHGCRLSPLERKRLLDFYLQSQSNDEAPRGALGYEWMSLHLEAIQEEREAIRSHVVSGLPIADADRKRLEVIERHLAQLKPVQAVSTALELKSIDLTLPVRSNIQLVSFDRATRDILASWENNLPGSPQTSKQLENAVKIVSSRLNDIDFITYFPAWLQVARSSEDRLRKLLGDFCSATLLAKRHLQLSDKETNISFFCNILYRVLHNTATFNRYVDSRYGLKMDFLKVVLEVRHYQVPALQVYQAVDVYHNILATPEDILARIEHAVHIPWKTAKSPAVDMLIQLGLVPGLSMLPADEKNQLDDVFACYRQLQADNEFVIAKLGEKLGDDLEEAFVVEDEAGKQLLAFEKQQNLLAQRLMNIPGLGKAIQNTALTVEPSLKNSMEKLWSSALALANQGPEDSVLARIWSIEKASRARAPINKAILMSLYVRADLASTVEKTGLSSENAQRLHDVMHDALLAGIRHDTLGKIASNLDKAHTTNDSCAIALDLLTKSGIPALNEPSMVLLQHEEKILLRPRQVSALDALLKEQEGGQGFNETVEKIIMGGGKSKVILPILAEKKARGDNLVVVEVPAALLATNHVDLNRTSQRLFGKRAYRFEFNRGSNCSPERLEQLSQHFSEIMTTRSYLVTTGEAIQSLELKYLELLLADCDLDETREKQIYWLDKITCLFRNHADCVIDEVHQGLWIKKKLNYTSGEATPISDTLIKNTTALYGFIDQEFIENAPSLSKDYDWSDFKKNLATKLMCHSASPLSEFATNASLRYGAETQADLIAYVTNTSETLCKAIICASAEERQALACFKREITVLLPQTLTRRLDEHYGASKQAGLSPVEKTLAIPYAANNVPNERSRFGVELEAINYTIQMMLLQGISKALLIERIRGWQILARQELFQNRALNHMDETPTARGFALQFAALNMKLHLIDVDNATQMSAIHAELQYNRPVVFAMLQDQCLKQIRQEAAIIHSDAFNHADLYRSVQAISGTPNPTTYHQRLDYDKTTSLGTDGYVINLIQDKNTNISSLDYQHPWQFINDAFANSSALKRTRAIIDIRATFQGVTNIFVAEEIARYIRTNPGNFSHAIKHVLYFNEDQILCAIDINKPERPILLASSDSNEINRLLGSQPGERFTYYDQAHTFGADITQDKDAHALVLADEKTSSQAFLQGCMRMRQLKEAQTMDIFVPESLNGISFPELINLFKAAERQLLLSDNPVAAKGQMTNLLRRRLLSLIQNLPSDDAQGKITLTRHFRTFFKDLPLLDFFELYGAINTKQATARIFARHQKRVLARWRQCMVSAGCDVPETEESLVNKYLEDIISKSLPHCLNEYEDGNDCASLEVEVLKEVQIEIELELLALKECYDPHFTAARTQSWRFVDCDRLYAANGQQMTFSMNKICAEKGNESSLFTSNLFVSHNFSKTYNEQQQDINAFAKPVFLIWYHIKDAKLHAMLVTPEETEELADCIKNLPESWISTTMDTMIAGRRPEGILEQERYQVLREQVRFFNGELAELVNQETPLIWLKEESIAKLDFFANTLQLYRPGSSFECQLLKGALTRDNVEGFAYVTKNPYEKLGDFDWKILFPKIIPVQALEYKKVARVFEYLNARWMHESLSLDDLQQQFLLPVNSLDYVNGHLTYLLALQQMLKPLRETIPKQAFLLELSAMEGFSWEQYLGVTLENICELHGICLAEADSQPLTLWQLADVRILLLLRNHPAMQDKALLDGRLLYIAKHAASAEVLLAILNIGIPSEALLMAIISSHFCDESLAMMLLDLPGIIPENLLMLLLKKDQTPALIEKLLQRQDLSETVCLQALEQINAGDNVLVRMIQHPAATTGVLSAITTKIAHNEAILRALVMHPKTDSPVLNIVASHQLFSLDMAQKIIERQDLQAEFLHTFAGQIFDMCDMAADAENALLEDMLIAIFEQTIDSQSDKMIKLASQKPLSAKLNAAILRVFGEDIFSILSLNEMIEKASETDLNQLIDLKLNFTPDNLRLLCNKTLHTSQIDRLLARPEMTSTMAEILFQNQAYSGKCANWEWLTEQQLINIMDKTSEYESLHRAITHTSLSENARKQWFDLQHQNMVAASDDPQQKIMAVLERLRIKACLHAVKSRDDASYVEVAEKAYQLYQNLRVEVVNQLQAENLNPVAFHKNCTDFVSSALTVLGEHRGYKQILLDIVNVLLLVVTLGIAKPKGNEWRLFKADTSSIQTVREITATIEEAFSIPEIPLLPPTA